MEDDTTLPDATRSGSGKQGMSPAMWVPRRRWDPTAGVGYFLHPFRVVVVWVSAHPSRYWKVSKKNQMASTM